jgi:Domain of unknown function (DUF4349)
MPRLDDYPIDPDVTAALDAIDATLAGEPVDPKHAELAELALLLADERPEIDPEFARSLDDRVARRFAARPGGRVGGRVGGPQSSGAGSSRGRRWMWKPIAGTLAAGFAAVVVVVIVGSGGGGSLSDISSSSTFKSAATTAASSAAGPSATAAPAPEHATAAAASGSSGSAASSAASGSGSAPAPQPPSNGRKIVQSAQLALTSAPNHVEDVAQEVFDVVGRENGVVNRSTVTATGGTDGYAQFQLRVPSGSLSATMNLLSRLRYAHVSSRTDNTQDVNDAYMSVTHRLADARALRSALLKQLANAVTQQQIDSLGARIRDAEASIASDEATIRTLNRRINFSQITLSINAASAPAPVTHGSGSFTLGKAAHDAGRVLTVAAGVALVGLAALVPIALIVALALWIWVAIRNRRREQALDAA